MTENEKINNLVWAEKYRPRTLEDAVLPESTKKMVKDALDNGNVPHFLFCGSAGTGKTTLARIIAGTLDADLLFINASLEGIDSIRVKVIQYASTVSFNGGLKFVLFDEFDGMSAQGQQSLRGIIEEFPNTRFLFTCNFKNKVIDAIHSRCVVVEFKPSKEEAPKLQSKFFRRIVSILKQESVESDNGVVAELVKKYYPDFRRTMNELQRYSSSGAIDAGILLNQSESTFKELVKHLKDKNFGEMRKWLGTNSDIDAQIVFTTLYDNLSTLLKPNCIPSIILILADRQEAASMVADPQIQLCACMTQIMVEAEWN